MSKVASEEHRLFTIRVRRLAEASNLKIESIIRVRTVLIIGRIALSKAVVSGVTGIIETNLFLYLRPIKAQFSPRNGSFSVETDLTGSRFCR
jgi:hypothetical protein